MLGRTAELGPLTKYITIWYDKLKDAISQRVTAIAKEYETRELTSTDGNKMLLLILASCLGSHFCSLDDHRVSLLTAVTPEKLVVIVSHEIVGSAFSKARSSVTQIASNIAEVRNSI